MATTCGTEVRGFMQAFLATRIVTSPACTQPACTHDVCALSADDRIPQTFITSQPSSGSPDTVIAFSSDVPVATYEYRIFYGRSTLQEHLLRNWTPSVAAIDYKDWLSGGTYTFQVCLWDADAVYWSLAHNDVSCCGLGSSHFPRW